MNYLFISKYFINRSDVCTKEDLIELKEGRHDYIIDTVNMKYFSIETNEWLPIRSK